MARRHRVEGLAWFAISRAGLVVPPAIAASFAKAAARIAKQNLRLALESRSLKKTLEAAGAAVLFVKGLSLAELAYGNILLKSGWDIDILVPKQMVEQAAEALWRSGYQPVIPDGATSPDAIAAFHDGWKESVWRHAETGVHVELHTALTDHPRLLPGVGTDSPRQEVRIAEGVTLPTLTTDELFAYLCVHGASSAWFRLKWIADLAALIGGCEEAEIERLYRRSLQLGVGRAAAVALLLCRRLFDSPVSVALVQELEADRTTEWMLRAVERSLTGRGAATELHELRLGTFWVHAFQYGILPDLGYKLDALRREAAPLRRLVGRSFSSSRKR